LIELADSEDEIQRKNALRVLRWLADPRAKDVLLQRLDDEHGFVRDEALRGLARLGPDIVGRGKLNTLLINHLQDKACLSAAIGGLSQHGDESAIGPLRIAEHSLRAKGEEDRASFVSKAIADIQQRTVSHDNRASGGHAAKGLKAVASCRNAYTVGLGSVIVEMYLQNVGNEEITYVDFKKRVPIDEFGIIELLVDNKPVGHYTTLDVSENRYKAIIERMSINGPTGQTPGAGDSVPPIPREAFLVLKPGEKVAYLKVNLQPARFKHETSKQALGPLQIPGEHIIQVEYQNSAMGRQFGLDAWTGKVRSNVVTVRVKLPRSLDEIKPEISNLLSKLKKLEIEHLAIKKKKLDSMSEDEKKRIMARNMALKSGMERELGTLSEHTARQLVNYGEPSVPILLEELWSLSWESDYSRNCIAYTLSRIGRPTVPYLIKDLQGRGPAVKVAHGKYLKVVSAKYKRVIISTLGQIRDSRAVEPLLDLFEKNKRAAIRWTSTIATAFGSIGDKRAVEPLITELDRCLTYAESRNDWDANNLEMRGYAGALGRIGDTRAIAVLKKALNAGPQTTKAGKKYLIAEEATQALRSLGQVAAKVTGHVVSPGGRRLAGAEISIDRSNAGIIRSNKKGEFSYYGYCYLLEATHSDWPGHKAMTSPQGPTDSINLTLQRTQKFEGRILDEKSEPISGARVTLQVFVGSSASGFATVWSGISDSSGSFVIEDTVPGTRCRMVIYAMGYSRAITESFFVHETGISTKNGSDMPRIIRMHPGREVTFRVLDPARNLCRTQRL
jgi:HEAT repeat protein